MATIYKVGGKNSGKDVSVILSDNRGRQYNIAEIGIMTHFEVHTDYANWETKSIINGGQSFFESVPHGVKASFKFARYSAGLENLETDYREASLEGFQLEYTLQYSVRNRDMSVNTRMLQKGKPLQFKLGDYGSDKDVEQSVEFVFSDIDRTKTS